MIMTSPEKVAPQDTLFNFISGFWVARSIYLAAKLGIADAFDDQPKTVAQLAAATQSEPSVLYRLLRALASVGLFTESNQCFTLTPLGATLKSDCPGSMRYAVLAQMGDDHSLGWSNGVHSLKTGEIAFDAAAGMPIWAYYAEHPEACSIFSQSMSSLGIAIAQAVTASYDFSPLKTIVDVGGAQGSLISTIVDANPHLCGILFDLPEIIANVKIKSVQSVAGNFFESVPPGGDAYIMRWIIHDWDDEKSSIILKNCHRAMPDHGKLLLVESILPPGDEPSPTKFIDLLMLLITGGKERTEAEYRALLASSGFELTRVIPTPSMLSIIEAVKI